MLRLTPCLKNRAKREKIRRSKIEAQVSTGDFDRARTALPFFVDNFCVIDDAQNVARAEGLLDAVDNRTTPGGTAPFKLWPAQRELASTLQAVKRVQILKARQLGISWLCCALALWTAFFRPGQVVMLFSIGQLEADELLRRIKALHDRLPEWMRRIGPRITTDNTKRLSFANGSTIRSLPATPKSGRSFTASLVIMDEVAHMTWGEGLYEALTPTIDGGGRIVLLSTANGIGNLFHDLWLKAEQGINDYVPCFLPWSARPSRDEAWYQRIKANAKDPGRVPQEYPATPLEAFLASGRARFAVEWLNAQQAFVSPPLPREAWPERLKTLPPLPHGCSLQVWRPAAAGQSNTIGADVAEGLEHGDADYAIVLDERTGEQLASLHGRWEPDEYAAILIVLAEVYRSTIVVERNNHGHAVLVALKQMGFDMSRVALGLDGRRGWVTDKKTKPLSIDTLAELLRDQRLMLREQSLLYELQMYKVLDGGKLGAPPGKHDDRVMGLAVIMGWIATRAIPRKAAGGGERTQLNGGVRLPG